MKKYTKIHIFPLLSFVTVICKLIIMKFEYISFKG